MTYITSSINVFFKDMGQIVAMILQILFWATPIFWTTKLVPGEYLWFIEYNPFYYIIQGYRETFIYHKWFWEDLELLTHFTITVSTLLIIGIVIFKRLKPHFADVL
jgi:lipopolysaccharide transport system permease protein/teichoic acid transport system permease protein